MFYMSGRQEVFTFNKDGDRLMNFLVWSLTPTSQSFYPMLELVPREWEEWNNYTVLIIAFIIVKKFIIIISQIVIIINQYSRNDKY